MSAPIDEGTLRVGISYHMCRLRDMPFDEEMVTNEAYAKFPVQPHELFFDVTTIKKVVEPEELVKEIRAKHKPNDMLIFVHALTGKVIGLELNDDYKVDEVKVLIQQQEGWVPSVQRLLRCGKPMADEKTLKDYNVTDRSSIHMVLSLRGGGCIAYELVPGGFDPRWNYNFSAIAVDPNPFYRGGSLYIRPLGSMRFAIRVLGKYENDLWLGCTGRAESGEWPVAFHGTTDPRAAEIVKSGGLKAEKGVRFQFGYGIYCTPDPKTALAYASTYFYKGQCYKLIVQARIDPARRDIIPKSMHGINGLDDFWIAKENDAIRPYGICVYRC